MQLVKCAHPQKVNYIVYFQASFNSKKQELATSHMIKSR